jgi:hypothetical protein
MTQTPSWLTELREKARAATQDWEWSDGHLQGSYLGETLICVGDTYEDGDIDCAHIASWSPERTLELLSLVEEMAAALKNSVSIPLVFHRERIVAEALAKFKAGPGGEGGAK